MKRDRVANFNPIRSRQTRFVERLRDLDGSLVYSHTIPWAAGAFVVTDEHGLSYTFCETLESAQKTKPGCPDGSRF